MCPPRHEFLDRVDGLTKQPLLVELIELEIHIRRIRGETIAIAEYQARFPGLSAARLEESLRTSSDPSPNNHQFNKTPAADLQTLDCGSQPNQTGNPKIVKYFGDYELLNIIAQGGMGIVYKARQISLNRIVAIKMILSGEFASKEAVDRFYSEAKAAALRDHPGIVPIFEVGEFEGKHFFSMVYVEGSSLASKLDGGPLEPIPSARMMLEVAQAVQYAHEQGVIASRSQAVEYSARRSRSATHYRLRAGQTIDRPERLDCFWARMLVRAWHLLTWSWRMDTLLSKGELKCLVRRVLNSLIPVPFVLSIWSSDVFAVLILLGSMWSPVRTSSIAVNGFAAAWNGWPPSLVSMS